MFEEQRCSLGIILKKKILESIERAKQRNEMLMSLFRTTANNIQFAMEKKIETIRRERKLFDDMKVMSGSIDEIKMLKEIYSNQEEI
jgi:hypothetical protein